jgi:hypothetical protein
MAKVGYYYHSSLNTTAHAAVGNTYDVAKSHLHTLIPDVVEPASSPPRLPGRTRKQKFASKIEGLHVRVTSIAGGATKLTCRITEDAAGNITLVPDTEADISTGISAATTGMVAYQIGIPLFGIVTPDSEFWVHVKTNAGTVTLADSLITWSE